jgi:hypothetical protein
MILDQYLIIKRQKPSRYGYGHRLSVRLLKEKPNLSSDEIAIKVAIDVPNSLFERLIPTVDIKLPPDSVVNPNADVAIQITAEEVADKLSLSVEEVRDGLAEMVRRKTLKYAGVGDEGIETPFFDTEAEVTEWLQGNVDDDLIEGYDIQGFTPAEIKKIEEAPEV